MMGIDLNADPCEFSSAWEFGDAVDIAAARCADERAAGNFPPFYVRRVGAWGLSAPNARVYIGRWGVFYSEDGVIMRDLNSAAPDFCRLGTFWRFAKACRVANALSMAFEDGQLHVSPRYRSSCARST